ncbi:hypothetical protein CS8_089290 [Cupriavidus sp. 8B]
MLAKPESVWLILLHHAGWATAVSRKLAGPSRGGIPLDDLNASEGDMDWRRSVVESGYCLWLASWAASNRE